MKLEVQTDKKIAAKFTEAKSEKLDTNRSVLVRQKHGNGGKKKKITQKPECIEHIIQLQNLSNRYHLT